MASSGETIQYSTAPSSWDEGSNYINYKGHGNYIDGYWYISAPSFLVWTQLALVSGGGKRSYHINLYGSYYDFSTATWSTEELMTSIDKTERGSGTYTRWWAHNCPDSISGVTADKHTDYPYYLWRVRQNCTSNGKKTVAIYAGGLGVAGSTFYTESIQYANIRHCGNSTNSSYSWSDGEDTRSSKYVWVPGSWSSGYEANAIDYFNYETNRGTTVYATYANKAVAIGGLD